MVHVPEERFDADDVQGLDAVIDDLNLKVLDPIMRRDFYADTDLLRPAKGVLLTGPPGTGKTTLAKLIANKTGCCLINLTGASLISKWLGDSNRLVRAAFSLAIRMQPCIIFIDEVEAILGSRGRANSHEVLHSLKTEFMQLWDGLGSSSSNVVVMGATNMRGALDPAVLRRFTVQHEIGLPSGAQRWRMLCRLLDKYKRSLSKELRAATKLPPSFGDLAAEGRLTALTMAVVLEASRREPQAPKAGAAEAVVGDAEAVPAAPDAGGTAEAGPGLPEALKATELKIALTNACVRTRPVEELVQALVSATAHFSYDDLWELMRRAALRVQREAFPPPDWARGRRPTHAQAFNAEDLRDLHRDDLLGEAHHLQEQVQHRHNVQVA